MIHCVFAFLLLFSPLVFCFPFITRLPLPRNTEGPESLAFDSAGRGPYTGVSDGRILRYQGPFRGFTEFASTTLPRNKPRCVGGNSGANSPFCGRPLGLAFNNLSELYIVDANFGLCSVSEVTGGQANCFLKRAGGTPFKFLEALDIDPTTGVVYFTEFSTRFNYSQLLNVVSTNDATGRLLSYDPHTRKASVLLTGLKAPSGVAVSQDGSFLLFNEFNGNRIQKYWLKGQRRNTAQILVPFISKPDNIKRTAKGDFWVASVRFQMPDNSTTAVRINGLGSVLQRISLGAEIYSEVNEIGRTVFLGSVFNNYVGRFNR